MVQESNEFNPNFTRINAHCRPTVDLRFNQRKISANSSVWRLGLLPGGGLSLVSIVPSDRIFKQNVFKFRPSADVVDDQWPHSVWAPAIDNNADVRKVSSDHPGDQVPGLVFIRLGGAREFDAMTTEEFSEIRNTSVVDIAIRSAQIPELWVGQKFVPHVEMNSLLQIDIQSSIATNNDVRTNSNIVGDITPWIGDFSVAAVITNGMSRAFQGSAREGAAEILCIRLRFCRNAATQ